MEKLQVFERKMLRSCVGIWRNTVTLKYLPNSVIYGKANLIPVDIYLKNLTERLLPGTQQGNDEQDEQDSDQRFYPHPRAMLAPTFKPE